MPSTPQRSSSDTMGGFKLLALAALASSTLATPLQERAKQPKSFFKEVSNSTWVIGNDVWNVTQGVRYANKLWYSGKDRVGRAAGHYVSHSKLCLIQRGADGNETCRRRYYHQVAICIGRR